MEQQTQTSFCRIQLAWVLRPSQTQNFCLKAKTTKHEIFISQIPAYETIAHKEATLQSYVY